MPATPDESSASAGIKPIMPRPGEMPAALTHPILSSPAPSRQDSPSESGRRPSLAALPNQDAGDRILPFLPSRTPSSASLVGGSLLREYARTIDPSPAEQEICVGAPLAVDSTTNIIHQEIEVHRPREESVSSVPVSPFLPLRSPRSFRKHRKNALSTDSVPRQTIMKALASRPPMVHGPSMPLAASLTGILNGPQCNNSGDETDKEGRQSNSSSQQLSAALSNLQRSGYGDKPASPAGLVLQSPCFFHQRFDDAVNIQKVLEEIADDEWLSHSRFVQTATGVREVSKQLQRRPIKRAVKNVMIVTKARDNSLVHLTRELAEWLLSTPRYGNDIGVDIYVDSKLRNSKRFDAAGLVAKDPRFESMLKYWTPDLCWTSPEKFDLVLTLGGDGTVLFTSWLFQRIVPPILSFSLGSLGFLTNFEFDKYKEHLDRVMGDGGMRVNLRMRFTCTVFRADRSKGATLGDVEEGEQFEVLNELVIDRGPSPYVSNLELYGDNELLTVVQADGCIFSTPTGKPLIDVLSSLLN